MKRYSIMKNDGIVVDVESQLAGRNTVGTIFGRKNQEFELPPKQMINKIKTELRKPFITYNSIALTENCIISLNETSGSKGLYTCIDYRDIVWIYESAPNTALIFTLYKALSKSTEDLPDDGMTMILTVVSKDEESIIVPDHKTYYRRGRLNRKVSKNFDTFEKLLLEKCPSDVVFGKTREAKISYLKKMEKEIPEWLLDEPKEPWYSEPQDEDDLL